MKYKVDYCKRMGCFEGAKEYYEEGDQVTLKYSLIASDTDYSFRLDGEPVSFRYEGGAFVISFTMPSHDVRLECFEENTMYYHEDKKGFSLFRKK